MKTAGNKLLDSRSLAKNVGWNIMGMLTPWIVALVTIPILIHSIGVEKFGVLSIIWMVIGYFSLFDLGLGRTLTKLIAEKLGHETNQEQQQEQQQEDSIATLVWTTMALMGGLSFIGALLVYSSASWLVYEVLNMPVSLTIEVSDAFRWLALSIPFVIMTTAFRGILEAYQYFAWVNALRLPFGIFNFLGPVAVLPFSQRLDVIVIVLLAGRVIALLVHVFACLKLFPSLAFNRRISMQLIPYLLSFGGWMSVTNIVGPLMLYLDRFLIGAVLTMSAVAFYTTPYELVVKLWLIPSAVLPVLFPAFSTAWSQGTRKLVSLYFQGMLLVFILIFPLSLIVSLFAYEGLALWLNEEFAQNSTQVLQLLAYGVFINSFALVSFSLVQGIGRPDLTAKLHLIELPFYLLGLWLLMPVYGIIGVALVWTLRISVDTLLLFFIVKRLLPESAAHVKQIASTIIVALLVIIGGAFMVDLNTKIIYLISTVSIAMFIGWNYLLNTQDRQALKNIIQSLLNRWRAPR